MGWGEPKPFDDPAWITSGKAWVEVSPGRKRLVELNRPRGIPPARSDFPCPAIRSDSIDPVCGADGKMHDSLSSYRKTLLPENNPKGERYFELGDSELEAKTYDYDPKQRRDDIRAAMEDVKNGNVPPPVFLED